MNEEELVKTMPEFGNGTPDDAEAPEYKEEAEVEQ